MGKCKFTILQHCLQIESILAGMVKTLIIVDGTVRPGTKAGHEYFGFQDGLSWPAIIGFRKPNTGEAPTCKS